MGRIAFIALSASLLVFSAPDSASAGWDGYHGTYRSAYWGGWRRASYSSSFGRGQLPLSMRYGPAQFFSASYYRSRGGIGRG
jgi:hypothetical protein